METIGYLKVGYCRSGIVGGMTKRKADVLFGDSRSARKLGGGGNHDANGELLDQCRCRMLSMSSVERSGVS